MMHIVFFIALVMADASNVPIHKVFIHKSQNRFRTLLTSLRLLQEQQEPWTNPDEIDVTPAPFARKSPTRQPVMQPIIPPPSNPPTSKPFPIPTPIIIFTPQPTMPPSSAPSVKITESPSQRPTIRPSQSPVAAPSQAPTLFPSHVPSQEPLSVSPSIHPTDRMTTGSESEEGENPSLTTVSLPMTFKARLEGVRESDIDELLPRVATVWRTFIREAVEDEFGPSSFSSLELAVTAERRRLRVLQTDGVVDFLNIAARGQLVMRFDDEEADTKRQEVRSFLDETISRENLQNALTSSDTNFEVTVDGENESQQVVDEKPKLWEIILGFSILAIALGTLVFWAMFFWRKRQKKLRKKKLAAIRSAPMSVNDMGSSVAQPPMPPAKYQTFAPVTVRPLAEGPRQNILARNDTNLDSFIKRALTDKESDDDAANRGPSSDESDTGSEFGRQLRMAASLDKASWEEFQRQKQALERVSRSGISSGGEHDGTSDRYNLGGEGEQQGIEVEHNGIHPTVTYAGDEKRMQSSRSKGSSSKADRYGTQDHGDSEPYGDAKDIASATFPDKARYLFSSQNLNDPDSSDDQSETSFRVSPTDSSWSGGDLTDMDEPLATLSMLKEVEELSQYVQQYEQKRESRKMRELELKQREFHNKQRLQLSMSASSPDREERQLYERGTRSMYSERILDAHTVRRSQSSPSKQGGLTYQAGTDYPGDRPREAYAIPQRSVLPSSFESFHSTDLSDGEDDVSQRLGITPQYPLVSDNNSNRKSSRDAKAERPLEDEKLSQGARRGDVEGLPQQSGSHASVYHASSGTTSQEPKPFAQSLRAQSQGEDPNSHEYHQNDAKRLVRSVTLPSRTAQGKITNIVTMFESKPHTAVVPPSPTWQYEN
ncbi:hypothetical protein FisN_5Hh342 [Fistulifera solaris]|uniref:SEA domain-containing protein n=1 Tax=Fistulifera solaris TaxID=1519565 RepID=A0A1Z5JSG1_FISSO|nr:hypothetical protein FisN_5Hh342 [Fistulifera solaris]|eukprot:GAX16964.1 hypothetical protein FisN_5Hh342 [Fistulifera solaris]